MKIFNTCLVALLLGLSNPGMTNTFKTEKWQTSNGVRVVFYPAMEVPMLDVSLAFAAGSAYDGNQFGLSALTAQMMNQGNAEQDATTIAEALADAGAQSSIDITRDMVVLNLRTLVNSEALTPSIRTFSQIINHPNFPDDAFAREKKQQLMAIEQVQESPEEIADVNFFKTLYQAHPYAHSINGTKETVNALNKNQLIEFYHRHYVANSAVLVMVGAINSQTAHQLAEQLTKDLPKGEPIAPINQATPLTKAEQLNIPFPSSQTMIRLGQIGINHHTPNYFPLMLGNYILGGGSLVSRLAVEVREKEGLTYGVDSQFAAMPGDGPFLISLSTRNNQAKQAIDMIQNILNTYINQGPSEKELQAAKQYLTGSFPLSLASNRSIATLLLRMTFYNLPDNYLDTYVSQIQSVTKDQIKEAFKAQVHPDKLLLITVGQS